ncbi:hypothetical protein BFJ63_vAg13986 [Fusarium oxysporum f. sp. narcissi]|jgi:hypothetical protein|uniref:Uncharacterized protein n=1 Tax=Fusarium oxysporum f. sp. narcissi TaxID=451672 RepID=A0A4Q2V860_FUSOX|nr:hypothetical protein BFJ63_vAg13986 [Fusarium oxysporum f. sp. narcissi]
MRLTKLRTSFIGLLRSQSREAGAGLRVLFKPHSCVCACDSARTTRPKMARLRFYTELEGTGLDILPAPGWIRRAVAGRPFIFGNRGIHEFA